MRSIAAAIDRHADDAEVGPAVVARRGIDAQVGVAEAALDQSQKGFDAMNSGQSGKVILNWD